MVEPVTLGVGAIAAYLGKDGLQKLLGPTADYLGGGLKDFTEKRFDTAGKIFANASKKLGSKLDEPGGVPPKLLKHIIDDGSFADDSVEIEYLGGVLASSRSTDSRDNRAARLARKIDSLSNYQLRAHYLIYRSIKDIFSESGISGLGTNRQRFKIFLPLDQFITAMEFSDSEMCKFNSIFSHIIFGLSNEGLIEAQFMFGGVEHIKDMFPNAPSAGIVCQPSADGIELFQWAFGYGDADLDGIFLPEFDPLIEGIPAGLIDALRAGNA
jgi:hypothetical protein